MKIKMYHCFLTLVTTIGGLTQINAQSSVANDSLQSSHLNEIIVSAVSVDNDKPMSFSNLTKKQIAPRNLGQDLPTLMGYMTSVVTTTDAGNGIGYSSFRVRGSDATRVNVTLNGIPYNDGESQGSFWVNMPDFASSVQNIQLQRGVGSSTNGAAAFGASLNLQTDHFSYEPYGEISNSLGSFNSRKSTLKFSTGLIDDKFEISGRLSDVVSDGYIDRASSDMQAYFLQAAYVGNSSLIKAVMFGGKQKTYQAWNGVDQQQIDEYGRRFNPAGIYFDDNGDMQFYNNETDNYIQDHYQLHYSEQWNDAWTSQVSLHYTKGDGYYENYKMDQKLNSYGLSPVTVDGVLVDRSDLIRTKKLLNHFYGIVLNATYDKDRWNVVFGGGANKYEGDHFGEVIWVKQPVDYSYKQEFYRDNSVKTDINAFAKATYKLSNTIGLFGDLQYRRVTYQANAIETGIVDDKFNFFNPKAGLTWQIDPGNQMYFSYARANREPSRNDYESEFVPKSEQLDDFELGYRFQGEKAKLNVNAFYMNYKNQLVLTGELNDVGAMIRANSGSSYRFGLEIDAQVSLLEKLHWAPSLSLSTNKNRDFKELWMGETKNFGKTTISFSPEAVASNIFTYQVNSAMNVSLLSKYVSSQYMSNTQAKGSKLDAYFINDINATYTFKLNKWLKYVEASILLNNIFDVDYISNGYYWSAYDGTSMIDGAGYYPQAQFNFLVGLTLKF